VIREDPNKRGLLYAGTEFGIYISIDGGRQWRQFMSGLPTVRVDDIIVHPRDSDLVIGTHGRHNLEKLFLGSVAERIFREAVQLVLTVGPHSKPDAPIEGTGRTQSFLFPTDFSDASLKALPHAFHFPIILEPDLSSCTLLRLAAPRP